MKTKHNSTAPKRNWLERLLDRGGKEATYWSEQARARQASPEGLATRDACRAQTAAQCAATQLIDSHNPRSACFRRSGAIKIRRQKCQQL